MVSLGQRNASTRYRRVTSGSARSQRTNHVGCVDPIMGVMSLDNSDSRDHGVDGMHRPIGVTVEQPARLESLQGHVPCPSTIGHVGAAVSGTVRPGADGKSRVDRTATPGPGSLVHREPATTGWRRAHTAPVAFWGSHGVVDSRWR